MIVTLLTLASILFLALQLEEKLNVPSPLGLIALSFVAHYTFQGIPVLTGDAEHFATLVIFLLPILLISDSLEVKVADLRQHAVSLLYLTVVSVVLSVVAALSLADWLFADYALSSAAVIVLFAMVLATDPVSVVSIFAKFELPHRLKILAEGESLLNDATALIIFVFVGLYMLGGGEIGVAYLTEISGEVVFGSVAIGSVIGFIGLFAMKSTQNRIAEMMVLVITGYGAFEISEHFYTLLNLLGGHSHLHLSGILSCIFATITVNHVLTRAMDEENQQVAEAEAELQQVATNSDGASGVINNLLGRIKATFEEKERHLRTKEDVQLLAMVANTILFVAMAEMIDLDLLWKYRVEIGVMFLATTVIRGVMMALFAWLANKTEKMVDISFRWWGVLTFAGIKGGLSIVMLTMIPASFEYLEMFKAVVIGVIMLSTFLYSMMLMLIIGRNKEHFRAEKLAEHP
ncbi:MAG: sodium:proton antiporter [Gallionellales bacterium CG_4_10_14_3_um_filter_54_96]|nr:MAG: sodium:proton antiporter [Gallionellales bacterium CG17_big_fil_post_rev_8_21_14_2_50_54_146]PIX04858.1 MAG: sodium:proton antiporter [Gallionellales bacterium CG_4_8_14_3_um_filter_54_18]PIY05636.1 MAG: sodium:proton antiporter [Gallionellales bacterium CG_4_10_14_3_um_filter_54_96]PJC03963.1 MAG: sodium:proton antiporter [Gallionellales bacterium CG_4_9_14_0_8_um_filter_55_61]